MDQQKRQKEKEGDVCMEEGRNGSGGEREPKMEWVSSENYRLIVPGNCLVSTGWPRGWDRVWEGGSQGGWVRGFAFLPPHNLSYEVWRLTEWWEGGDTTGDVNQGACVWSLGPVCQDSPPSCQPWKRGGLGTCWATLSPCHKAPRECRLHHTQTEHIALTTGEQDASGRLPSASAKCPKRPKWNISSTKQLRHLQASEQGV